MRSVERGIRAFETPTRNPPDLAAAPVLKTASHLAVIVDPTPRPGGRDRTGAAVRQSLSSGTPVAGISFDSRGEVTETALTVTPNQ